MRPPRTPPIRLDKDVLHLSTPRQHRIPNQRPMTPPRHRLRTHHHRRVEVRQPHQPIHLAIERLSSACSPHTPKALVPPPRIHAVLLRPPPPTQPLAPHRPNPRLIQRRKQPVLPKLRMPPRPRKPPHIHQRRAPVLPKRPQKRRQSPVSSAQSSSSASPHRTRQDLKRE